MLRAEINALNRAGTRPDPFSSFEFFENFLRYEKGSAPGQGLRLWFLVAIESGRLIGYLALKQVNHKVFGLRAPKIDFLVTHDADRPQLVCRPEHAKAVSEAFYNYLLQHKREWSFLEFRQQDAASPLFPPPGGGKLKGCWVGQWPSMDNGTIPVSWPSLQAYFRSFSKKFRSNVSRQMRSLLAAGEVEYLVSSDPDTTPALFELYRSIEPRSWKSRAGVNIGRHPQWVEYFQGLLAAHQPMRVSIHLLLLDGVPIAGLITGAFGQGLYALHIVYDHSLSQLGPGSAILLMSMRQAIDGRYAFFNLLSGFGYYKVRWQAQMSETRNVQIYRIGTPFFWRRVVGDLKRRLFPVGAPQTALLFNPMRRDTLEHEEEPTHEAAAPNAALSTQERVRIAALITKVRNGEGEFLSSTQLATLMPFDTQRSSEKTPAQDRADPNAGVQGCCASSEVGTVRSTSRKESSTMPITLMTSPASTPSRAPAVPKRCMPK